METILLIEDNEAIRIGLEYSLIQEGFEIAVSSTIQKAKELLEKSTYDLILLDIGLPDGDGYDLCEYIKKHTAIPIIFLTARDEEKDVVQGLDMGAEDYVIKPFRTRELISRIHNVLRRKQKQSQEKNQMIIQNILLNFDQAEIKKDGETISFTALEYKLFVWLCMNKGKVLTRQQILDKIWDMAGNFVNDNTLTVYIKRIREKIEEDPMNPKILLTVRGIGYKIQE